MKIKAFLILVLGLLFSNCNSFDKPYTPEGLEVKNIYREWKNANFLEVSNFSIYISNNTKEDFKMVKYRVKIFSVENGENILIFSKAYEYHQRLNSGDVVKLPIYDLEGFHVGVDVREENGWSWRVSIENAEPL
jgi:hypothetical protein